MRGTKHSIPQYWDWPSKKESGRKVIMFEWLKTILGESYTDDIDKKVSDQIGKDFVAKTDFNTVNEAKKTAEKQVLEKDNVIKDRDKQLEDLKKVDAAGLQAEIIKLQGENQTAKTKFDADLKATQLEYKLETRLLKENAVNPKAVKALLDLTKISLDGENLLGLDDQLKTIKETEKWAFGATAPAGATGIEQGAGTSAGEKTDIDEMREIMYPKTK